MRLLFDSRGELVKIKHQLLLTHGILVALSVLIVIINGFAYIGMQNDATIINQSGRMRALSYNMGLLANRIHQNETVDSQAELLTDLRTKMSEFERIVRHLDDKTSYGIKYDTSHEKLDDIIKEWEGLFKPLFVSILEDNGSTDILNQINSKIDAFVIQVNNMVGEYSSYSQKKVMEALLINAALVIVIILVTTYSFKSTNKHVRRPMVALINELKELALIDEDVSKKLENIETSEFSEMSLYFNELMFDHLTKAYTRKAGLAKLSKYMSQDNRRHMHLCLCFIDINGLKLVNDVLGHKVGDELIVSSINVIKNEIRDEDYVIRMGGDEFLIVFKEVDEITSESVWKRINEKYDQINISNANPYIVSVSHGIVEYDNSKKSAVDDLIKHADDKMYIEKQFIKEELNIKIIK